MMQKITPFLWFDDQAEEAAKFYVSVFKNSRILKTTPYMKAAESVSGKKAGSVMTVEFEIEGQKFVALNGGPYFTISEAVSFVVNCKTQEEIDEIWNKLSANKEAEQCGWLKDKFGVSWQIVPEEMNNIFESGDEEKRNRVMQTLLEMKKIDIKKLKAA